MADCESKDTPSQPPKQLSQQELINTLRKIIANKLTDKELLDMQSYIRGLLQVAKEK